MKVLIDHPNPFLLAHGGFQTQIEQTRAGLDSIGIEIEWLRWWDASQTGDIIHYFGRPNAAYIDFAHRKRIRVVISELLTGLGSRSAKARALQRGVMLLAQRALPKSFTAKLSWDSYQCADAITALTPWEAELMESMFDAPRERLHIVPNGVEPAFFESPPVPRGKWLVCTATIAERKRVVELAQAAIRAEVPVWFIGTPYSETDAYYRRFQALAQNEMVRYEGGISDRTRLAAIYRESRGFVLLSTMESLSLSALEAAACETPLLLSDLPWAKSSFGAHASYCPHLTSPDEMARKLRAFYETAPSLPPPPKPETWTDIARRLEKIYRSIL